MTHDDSRLFIADFHPALGAYLARRHESGYDAVAGRARFLFWMAAHVDGVDTLRDYLARAERAPRLTAESEAGLAARVRAGRRAASQLAEGGAGLASPARAELERAARDDAQAEDQLLEANLYLVVAMAKRFAERGAPFADLVQAGHRGLVRAVEKYDPARGYRFGTYATWWIRKAITRAVVSHALAGSAPASSPGSTDALTEAEQRILRVLGREPSPEELAAELDLLRP